ncbi:MAG: hypothetical protein Q9220_007288 [cf. Caloplaca sp. 1 TL-2023]
MSLTATAQGLDGDPQYVTQGSSLAADEAEGDRSTRKNEIEGATTESDNRIQASALSATPSPSCSPAPCSPITQEESSEPLEPTRITSSTPSTTASKPPMSPHLAVSELSADTTSPPISSALPEASPNLITKQDEQDERGDPRLLENGVGQRAPSVLGEEPYPPSRADRFFASLKKPPTQRSRRMGGGKSSALKPSFKTMERPSSKLIKVAPLQAASKHKTRAIVPAKYGKMFYTGLGSVAVLLVLHVALICHTSWSSPYGITIFTSRSSCGDLRTPKYLLLLMVNIFALTVGLVADKALRCVLSPARQDLDAAHEVGQYLTVGVVSFRNWKRVRWPNKIIAVCLVLSSLPLSLL